MKNKSVMQHNAAAVPSVEIERSKFDRSHGVKTTFDAGKLIPFYVDEALPGDTFNLQATLFGRLATPIFPIMDNAYIDTHYFAVPYRLIWDNWEKFNGAQDNPDDSIEYTIPQMTAPAGGYTESSIQDYMGIPTKIASLKHNALHLRAYNLIYNEWYRDQNLQDRVEVHKGDGPDPVASYKILDRGKRHDYFTSCLPWPQKGTAVALPSVGSATLVKNDEDITFETGESATQRNIYKSTSNAGTIQKFNTDSGLWEPISDQRISPAQLNIGLVLEGAPAGELRFGDELGMRIETMGGGGTINDLRRAFQIQKLLERDARGGTRYIELIKAHFNVSSDDARLQRPEYLGGDTAPVSISPIEQTSSTDTTTPQGNLAAMGTITSHGNGFTKSFTEHNLIIGIMSVRADLTYQKGLDRMWFRQDRYDFFWPALAHIGEQAVLDKEIYATGDKALDDMTFGYQARYNEYRGKQSMITGLFRSNATGKLDNWHLSQNFASLPELGDDFIKEKPPFDRVIAVPSEPHFILDAFIKLHCARPLPLYGTPGMMDRF